MITRLAIVAFAITLVSLTLEFALGADAVSQVIKVEAGTAITISRNGQTLYQKIPAPGYYYVQIHPVSQPVARRR